MTVLQTMGETSLYDDHSYSGSMSGESSQNSPSEGAGGGLKRPTGISLTTNTDPKNIKELKKNLTLDFTSPESAKKTLATPDLVRFLQLATPEFEKFFTQGVVQVTSPTPTNFLFPKNVTSEQEQYARGFIDALNHIHHQNDFRPGANLLSPAGIASLAAANSVVAAAAQQQAASSSKSTPTSTAADPATSTGVVPKQSPSATDPSTVASVIMSTVHSFPMNLNSYSNFLSAGLPSPATAAGIPAAMALLGFGQNNTTPTREQKSLASSVLSDERPPSQSAESGSMEFTNLSQAQAAAMPAAGAPIATTGGGSSFHHQQAQPAHQYLDVVNTANQAPAYKGNRMVKQEQDQAVPNVSLQMDGSFGIQPGTAVQSVLDLKTQEQLKLERKRHRNRIAATKCRKRKMEKISDLEGQVREQEEEKRHITQDVTDLKNDIAKLRADLELHRNSGCAVPAKIMNGVIKMD